MNAYCTCLSASLQGVHAQLVSVEVSVGTGLPGFTIVGMADTAIQEAKERIKSALRGSGFRVPQQKIVVNLAPGFVRKNGTGFDLPIALGILVATGQAPASIIANKLVAGELSLTGEIRPVVGACVFEMCALEHKLGFLSAAHTPGLMMRYQGKDVTAQIKLAETLIDILKQNYLPVSIDEGAKEAEVLDFSQIAGLAHAKRALSVAVAGGLSVLMTGPPGAGKSMLAKRMISIMPSLAEEELAEVVQIYSAAGLVSDVYSMRNRPFRSPHHSISLAGLIGGSSPIKPGEVTLAHLGILFLDELAEFQPRALQALREPLEVGEVHLTRAKESVKLPARFMLVAATNPCPCGYLGDERVACTCMPAQVSKYQNKIGGPLLDRIDIHLSLKRSQGSDLFSSQSTQSSEDLRRDIDRAQAFGSKRVKALEEKTTSKAPSLIEFCEQQGLSNEALSFLLPLVDSLCLSGRVVVKVIAIARILADFEEKSFVEAQHIAEALTYRCQSGGSGAQF